MGWWVDCENDLDPFCFVDGKEVGENTRYFASMAAQRTMGIWLPGWSSEARWQTVTASFASVEVWRYDGPGDVRGILTNRVKDNFAADGRPIR